MNLIRTVEFRDWLVVEAELGPQRQLDIRGGGLSNEAVARIQQSRESPSQARRLQVQLGTSAEVGLAPRSESVKGPQSGQRVPTVRFGFAPFYRRVSELR